jgi:aspartyl-tRNA(Asn)/glutamyl-tRNA(Gln) amidotransferase subunit C
MDIFSYAYRLKHFLQRRRNRNFLKKFTKQMAVSKQDVEYIAALAKLSFSEAEKEKLTAELNTILTYVEKLNELDTSNVEPLQNINERVNVLRDDTPTEPLSNEAALQNAPDFQDRFFKVPKVISQGE